MTTHQVRGVIPKEIGGIFTTGEETVSERKGAYTLKRLRHALSLWGVVFFSATNTALVYPFFIKVTKKVTRLNKFWPLHFAVFPLLVCYNSICVSTLNVLWYYHTILKRVERMKEERRR
eukprot:TRINITY_DN10095_c0_g1_i2.p1 TRINITY_DN10095_c0_g1~~TRINITY_DN10095_c0_g1_i2.p1  ORF type:complete len:119 (-),score=7.70 TRINITY_DN10095_c0_g1_i2:127-483(-)